MVEFRWMEIVAASALVVALILGFIAYNVAWVNTDGASEGGAAPTGVVGEDVRISYGADQFDEVEGRGLAQTGGVLLLIGLISGLVAVVAYEHRLFTGVQLFSTVGFGAAALATLLLVVGLILFPIGAGGMAKNGFFAGASLDMDVEWKAGLYLGVLSTVFAIGGGIMAAVSFLKETDFKLETPEANSGPANFD